jgi:RHS repeat-associated protein
LEQAIKYRDINIPIADSSTRYRCYLSIQFFEVPCPECGGLLAQKYSVGLMYIKTEHYEADSFILLDRYSYFCTRCPVVVVDARIPKKIILDGINGEKVIDNSFKGISPDGQFLVVAVNEGSQVGFFDFTNQGSTIQVYLLGTDYLSATLQNTIPAGGYVNVQGLSFSTDSKNIYYTSTSSDAGYQLQNVGVNNTTIQTVTSLGAPSDIALAPNDKMYVSTQAASSLLEVTTGDNAAPTLRNLSLGLSNGALLTGVIPTQPHLVFPVNGNTNLFTRELGNKTYELKDHLGDVRMVISDRKLSTLTSGKPSSYQADIINANNYYPFGMLMPQRTFNTPNYRFGFNGKEKDDEFNGNGVTYDYGARVYDARIGRFLSVDPLTKKYPELTPYQFGSNRPIDGLDLDGKEWSKAANGDIIFKAVIVNNSGKNISLQGAKYEIEKQFKAMFGKGFNIQIRMEYNQSKLKVAQDEAKIEFLDPEIFTHNEKGLEGGFAQGPKEKNTGGRYIAINSDVIDLSGRPTGLFKDDNGFYAHEIGHSGGLDHPFDLRNHDENNLLQMKDVDFGNFMSYPQEDFPVYNHQLPIYKQIFDPEIIKSTKLNWLKNPQPATSGQKEQINKNLDEGKLNQGGTIRDPNAQQN